MTVRVTVLEPADLGEAARVAARGMRDNPLHRAAVGDDPERRVEVMRRSFVKVLGLPGRSVLGAWDGGQLVGVAARSAPEACQPTVGQQLSLLPTLLRAPVASARIGRWMGAWARHDPATPHVHLGPVGVDLDRQRQGIGSRLLDAHVADLDAEGATGYLETDKDVNVPFYERAGYEVVEEADVIGVHCWFMTRAARPPADPPPTP